MRRWPLAASILVIPALALHPAPAGADDDDDDDEQPTVVKKLTLEGTSCHGANVFNGEQVATWDDLRASWGNDVPQTTRDFWAQRYAFREIGAHGVDGPVGIDASTPLDSIMANFISPEGLELLLAFGWLPAADDTVQNRPIHDPLTWVTPALDRGGLPAADTSLPKYVPVRNTLEPVTLEQWNSAKGKLHVTCFSDGSAHVVFRGRNFLPKLPYTFWAIHAATEPDTLAANAQSPLIFWALGGVPAAAIASNSGKLYFERDLHYCPLDLDDPFMYLGVYPHWDGSVWGNQPQSVLFDGFTSGNAAAVQMCVPVGEHLLDL